MLSHAFLFGRNVRLACRFLVRNWRFTLVACATLALGLGVNTAIFSVAYGIALKPLPFPGSSTIVELGAGRTVVGERTSPFLSVPAMEDVIGGSRTLERIGYRMMVTTIRTGIPESETLDGMLVSAGFFDAYGVSPELGRTISFLDTDLATDRAVVLSHEYWERAFGRNRDVLGKVLTLSVMPQGLLTPQVPPGKPYIVIGVMPPKRAFPVDGDLWLAQKRGQFVGASGMGMSARFVRNVTGIARLRKGVSLTQARQELHALANSLGKTYPDTDGNWDIIPVPLLTTVSGQYRTAILLLMSAVTFILVLAALNVASLIMARSSARAKDVAILLSVGARRWLVVEQLLVESVVLALLAGAVGLAVARGGVHALHVLAPDNIPRLREVEVTLAVVGYALVASICAGIAIGLVPALKLTAGDSIVRGARRVSPSVAGLAPFRVRGFLIGLQIALAFPLAIGATMAARSLDRLLSVDLGYRRDHLLTMTVKVSPRNCTAFAVCVETIGQLVSDAAGVPGVQAAAVAATAPLSLPLIFPITVDHERAERSNALQAEVQIVTPGYFQSLGIPVRAGRVFDDHDRPTSEFVAVVNDTLARQKFDGNGVGHRINLAVAGRNVLLEIVGQVPDVRDANPALQARPTFYMPLGQANLVPRIVLLVRTTTDPVGVAAPVRARILALDPEAVVTDVRTMDDILAKWVADPAFQGRLLSGFAATGIAVALIGIYGLISYTVSVRSREFGIRLALGATPRTLTRLVLRESIPSLTFGLSLGAAAAVAGSRLLQHLLFQIRGLDALMIAGLAALMSAAAIAAYYLPTRSLAHLNPVETLRAE